MTHNVVSLQLGFGWRGEETTVSMGDSSYRCVRFQVEIPGAQIRTRSIDNYIEVLPGLPPLDSLDSGKNLTPSGNDSREIMVHVEHPVFQTLRPLVSREEAEIALSVFGATDAETLTWDLPTMRKQAPMDMGNAILDYVRLHRYPSQLQACRLIRRAGKMNHSYGGAYRLMYMWQRIIYEELATALEKPRSEIHAILYRTNAFP